MRFTKYISIAAIAAAALLAGCADDEQLGMVDVPEAVVEAENTANANTALTPEQQLMKQNLDAAAQLLVAALNKPTVQRELHQLNYLKTEVEAVSFNQLLRSPAKDGRFMHLTSEISRTFDAGAKNGNAALMDYLIEQGCGLYMPVPLDQYEAGAAITVVGDPIADVDENIGYVLDATNGMQRAVLVNEAYVDKNPILVVTQPMGLIDGLEPGQGRDPGDGRPIDLELMPDPDWGGGGWFDPKPIVPPAPVPSVSEEDIIGSEDFPEDRAGKICKIEIGAAHLSRKPKLWQSTVVRVGRANALGASLEYVEFTFPYNVARAGYKGWSQHGDGGWVAKASVYDSRWYCKYVDQILYAYIKRGDDEFTANLSVKYKEYVDFQIGMKKVEYKDAVVEVSYKGEDLCHSILNRTSFIRTLNFPSENYSKSGETWPVYGFGDLKLAMRVVWL